MTSVEATGRTVEEAVQQALGQMSVDRDEVDVEVIQEPRPALLGFGGREARVRVTRRPNAQEAAEGFVTRTLALMGYEVTASVEPLEDGVTVTFEGRDVATLIGRHGKLLDALEVLLAMNLQQSLGRRVQVAVDAAGYRARREKALLEQARAAVERAVAEGTAVALEPMEPRDRRIVHLALRDDDRVRTESEGEGDHRRVVIKPGAAEGPAGTPDDSE